MTKIETFIFNPFQLNTYLLYDETKECAIIDAGNYNQQENDFLKVFIEHNDLKPVLLLNTHCHVDHILGNEFISDEYGLRPVYHKKKKR